MATEHDSGYRRQRDLDSPGQDMYFVTANDSTDLPNGPCRALLVGTPGVARLVMRSETDTGGSNLVPLVEGYNPIQVRRVYATGLTATDIWAIY